MTIKDLQTHRNLTLISPFFIVKDLQASIAYYIERMGFRARLPGSGRRRVLRPREPRWDRARHEWARWDAYIYTLDPDTLFDELKERGSTSMGDR